MDLESMFDPDRFLTGANDYNDKIVIAPPLVVVADLPTVEGHGDCAICLEDFRPGEDGKRIPCGHVNHETCLSKWLSKSDSCPYCRHRIAAGGIAEAA